MCSLSKETFTEVVMRARKCMEKLVVESKNLDNQCEKIQHLSAAQDNVRQAAAIVCTCKTTPTRRAFALHLKRTIVLD